MIESVWILHGLLAAILIYFWWQVRAASMDALLARATREHHRVHAVLARHPRGGTWRQYRRWLEGER